MRKGIYLVVSWLVLVSSVSTLAAELHSPAPQMTWKVGDSWTVRTWNPRPRPNASTPAETLEKGDAVDLIFKVRRLLWTREFQPGYLQSGPAREVFGNPNLPPEGYPCMEVEVTYPTSDPEYRKKLCLYFRRDTGNLIRIQDVSNEKGEEPGITGVVEFADANGPTISAGRSAGFMAMFDFPDFTKDPNFSCEKRGATGRMFTSQAVKPQGGGERPEYEVTMVVRRDSHEYKTVQKWRKGDPWWYESRRFEDGKAVGFEAVLVRNQ
jgi:hypothetical protein